jgi:hypothetical protein
MSDTEEIKDTATTTEEPTALVPVGKIKPFYLTGTVHHGVLNGRPEEYLPKEALPYLRQEKYFTIDPSDKQDWNDALARKVGGGQVCPYCDGKVCASGPLTAEQGRESGKPTGYVFARIVCDNGPDHAVKIEFYGKEAQPDLQISAYWSCTRNSVSTFNDQAFTCKQTGGM